MANEVETLLEAAKLLTDALRTVDNERGKQLLLAHSLISKVRSDLEREEATERFSKVIGFQ